jgi:hypothetical protein
VLENDVFDVVTAVMTLLLSATGIVLRTRRLVRLRRVVLVRPVDLRDVAYLASVKRSTILRMAVKCVFFLGAILMLFEPPYLWAAWRVSIVVVLVFMLIETLSVDTIRDRLGRVVPEAG